MRLAVFDVDGTLVTGASTEKRFGLHLVRKGHIGPRQVLAFLGFLLRELPGYGTQALKKNKAYLAGLSAREMGDLAAAWVGPALAAAWFEPCVARLRRHQQAGDVVILLSGTPQFIAAAIGRVLHVDHVVGTRCALRDERFLPLPPLRHPFGEDKVGLVRELAREYGVDTMDVIAYGDSIHDAALFKAVGKAVAVRPDERLSTLADAEGWDVVGPVRRSFIARLWSGQRPAVGDDLPDRH